MAALHEAKMKKVSRREVLKQAAVGGGAALVCAGLPRIEMMDAAARSVAGPSIKFPTVTRERLAVATWPFRAVIESPNNEYRDKKQAGMDLKDFAARVKKEFGVPGVEPLSAHFPSTEGKYLHEFREAIERAGVHAVNLAADNANSFYDADAGARKKAVEYAKKWIDVAVVIGAPSVRTAIAGTKNAKPDVNLAAEQLKQVAEYGAKRNVVVNLENDNLESEDAFFLVKVIEKVNHPFLHALPDFCNSMASGSEKFNYDAVAALFPLAYCICHVKDSEVVEEGKVIRVDLKKTFGILKASGYRGYCSMEWEGQGSSYDGTRFLIKESLENLG
jgi:sugar phosphate isomerase/epimerase